MRKLKKFYQWVFRKGRYSHRVYCPYRYSGGQCTCDSSEVA